MKKARKNSLPNLVLQQGGAEATSENLQEELRLAKENAENVAKLYTDLYVEIYNFAPAGYFKLDLSGKICELNVHGAKTLSRDRAVLISGHFSQFITADSLPAFDGFFKRVFERSSKESCEVRVLGKNNNLTHLLLEGFLS